MQTCILDGATIRDKETLHTLLAKGLNFPCWYGRNLDALFDCLTDPETAVTIRLLHRESLEERLGRRGLGLVRLLRRAAEEQPQVTLREE